MPSRPTGRLAHVAVQRAHGVVGFFVFASSPTCAIPGGCAHATVQPTLDGLIAFIAFTQVYSLHNPLVFFKTTVLSSFRHTRMPLALGFVAYVFSELHPAHATLPCLGLGGVLCEVLASRIIG